MVRGTADIHDAGDVDMGPIAAMGRICEAQDGRVILRVLESVCLYSLLLVPGAG